MADRPEKPKRLLDLGWIEVEKLYPADTEPKKAGTWFLNLDAATMIHFPENEPGVAYVHFGERSVALEDANHARLKQAIADAQL